MVEVRSEDDSDADYARRLGRARAYGVEEVVLVAPYAVGGVVVEHLRVDPSDPTRFRTVALSATADQRVRVDRLGIELAGGDQLHVWDEEGPWPDPVTAFTRARRADEEARRAAQLEARLRAAGIDPTIS